MSTEAKRSKTKARGAAVSRAAPTLPTGCEAFVGKAQICFALGVSIRTFATMRSSKEFPEPDTFIGKFPRWRVETLNLWIRKRSGLKEG